jgi:large subunit ribosomal protein L25
MELYSDRIYDKIAHMDRLSLDASERVLLGKKVKNLRKEGQLPGHVFGKGVEVEHVSVDGKTFLKTYLESGATGVIDLKIGSEKVRPVMVRGVQFDAVSGKPLHIDFYQVNLTQKVTVPVQIEIIGEEPEKVHLGEAIVLQTLNEVSVEALPTDLIEKLEVNISGLKEIDDAITLGQLSYDRDKLTVLAEPEEVVVKLAPAVSAEMEELLEEQAAETEAAAEGEGEEVKEGEAGETANEQEAEAEEKGSEGGGNDQGEK